MSGMSRRSLLKAGGAVACSMWAARATSAATDGSAKHTAPNATRAGTITFGGDMQVNRLGFGPANNPAFDPPAGYQERMAATEKQHGLNKYQGGIAWLLSHSRQILPIPGTTSVDHLEENIAAAAIRYSPQELKVIG